MAAWAVFWVGEDAALARRSDLGPAEAATILASVIKAMMMGWVVIPALPGGVGALTLGGADVPLVLQGASPKVMLWSRGELVVMQLSEVQASELAESEDWSDAHRALLFSVDADRVAAVNDTSVGEAIYRLIDHPHLHETEAEGLVLRRGPWLSLDDERWVVWVQSELRDPATLTPPEIVALRPALEAAAASDGDLALAGFVLQGYKFEELFLDVGPGALSVLFGRNGAGKSLALGAIESALRALRDQTDSPRPRNLIAPTCTVLLDAGRQEDAAPLLAVLLAHLGWSPLSELPMTIRRGCMQRIAAWSSHDPRPQDAPGITVPELAATAVEKLRAVIADQLAGWLAGGPSDDTRVLAEAVVSSAVLAVTPDWRVGLAFMPGRANEELVHAAQRHLELVTDQDAKGIEPSNLHWPIGRIARQLAGLAPGQPVVTLTAELAHPGELSRLVHPDSGWLQLGENLRTRLIRNLPEPVVLAPGRDADEPADAVAEAAVLRLVKELLGPGEPPQSQGAQIHPFAEYRDHAAVLAETLQVFANRALPRFVAEAGTLKLGIAEPGEWHLRRATAMFTGGLDGDVPIDALPSGLKTWAMAALSFARAQLLKANWVGEKMGGRDWRSRDGIAEGDGWHSSRSNAIRASDPCSLSPVLRPVPNLLYLLDEPEAHLHLTAQRDVVELADSLARGSCGAVVATHSLAFLDVPTGRGQIVTLHAAAGKIRSSTRLGLRELADNARALGITTSALAMTCRAVLAVEGRNDREIIERYGGVDLDNERVIIVALRGHHGGAGIAELEFLHALRIPIFVLLDHVRHDKLGRALGGRSWSHLSGEELTLLKLHQALRDQRLNARAIPFPHLDIIRAVPEPDIAWALQRLGHGGFIGWKKLDSRAQVDYKTRRTKFKDSFAACTGASVEQVIRCLVEGDRTGSSPDLHGLLVRMLDDISGVSTLPSLGVQQCEANGS